MDDDTLLRRKLMDTANRAFTQNIYTYTNFLGLNELSLYYSMEKELSFIHSEPFGGHQSCERQIIQFGSEKELGYTGTYPIDLLCVRPLIEKFADVLSHRDYLGALMNLGIERSLIGDIFIDGHTAYIYCIHHIAGFITENLHMVKHTHVNCSQSDVQPPNTAPILGEVEVIAASPRLDAVVASLTNLSRNSVLELFRTRKIFLNGRCMENNSSLLKMGDILVIRGNGKYIYDGEGSQTRKGRVYIRLKKYE